MTWSSQSDVLRNGAVAAFAHWESSVSARLRLLQTRRLLRTDADPEALAETTIALLQGGYLLSSIKRDIRPMRSAVDAAAHHLEFFRTA
ncbi:MAG: TetR family transcriptional regulator C-terminal domain-containing protein [Nocardioidaceae bacterium]